MCNNDTMTAEEFAEYTGSDLDKLLFNITLLETIAYMKEFLIKANKNAR